MIEGLNDAAAEHANKNYATDKGYPEEGWYISWLSFNKGAKWHAEQMEKLKDFDTWKEWKNKSE